MNFVLLDSSLPLVKITTKIYKLPSARIKFTKSKLNKYSLYKDVSKTNYKNILSTIVLII